MFPPGSRNRAVILRRIDADGLHDLATVREMASTVR